MSFKDRKNILSVKGSRVVFYYAYFVSIASKHHMTYGIRIYTVFKIPSDNTRTIAYPYTLPEQNIVIHIKTVRIIIRQPYSVRRGRRIDAVVFKIPTVINIGLYSEHINSA